MKKYYSIAKIFLILMFFVVPFSSFAQTNTSEYYDPNSGNASSTAQEPIPSKEDTQKIVNEGEAGAANENQLIKNEFDLSATPQEDGAESMKDNTEDALSVANVASKNDLRAIEAKIARTELINIILIGIIALILLSNGYILFKFRNRKE